MRIWNWMLTREFAAQILGTVMVAALGGAGFYFGTQR